MAMVKALGEAGAVMDFFEQDNAKFRRHGRRGGVDEVLHGNDWHPYTGDRLAPALYGDAIEDPCGESMQKTVAPALLFFKKAK
ncbi:MAG TPA: hypothetical protein VMV54_06355 [Acidocella sp.]|nr:hypothetical protein [Acidocella sp.]